MSKLKIKEVFRYGRPYKSEPAEIDGFRNHFAVTSYSNLNFILLEKGISPVGSIRAKDGFRTPAIIIRSSPHKIGTETTPWQDVFDIDNGYIRYYGDNKLPGVDPSKTTGNRILLDCFQTYNDISKRKKSIPLIFYKAVAKNNKAKGYIEFNGFGIITAVELVTQFDRKLNTTFTNYAFAFQVFSLARENELFNWKWINDRRNEKLIHDQTIENAPLSWIEWLKHGNKVLERTRRRVSKLLVITKNEQAPVQNSKEAYILKQVYDYYQNRKARFEGLAAEVTAKIFKDTIGKFHEGWITPSSSDGGADFYARVDLGTGFGKVKLIVLGQAKCESINVATGGNHIARTVARLRRGWFGVYVTTSFFSEAVQREVIEDEYPIMLINGKKLSETILKIIHDQGYSSLKEFLNDVDLKYESLIQIRRPEELLFIN